ncbi:MAG: PHP domain-containing protein, partial [Clostridia bacterium]|nr:PHP domain-containing protein [Clostridia bacterium]
MNEELRLALEEAGASREGMTLERAVLSREAGCLTVFFRCAAAPSGALLENLQRRLDALFPELSVRLLFPLAQNGTEEPERQAEAAADAVAPVKSPLAGRVLMGKSIKNAALTPIEELGEDERSVTIEGDLITAEAREPWAAKNGADSGGNGSSKAFRSYRVQFSITDGKDSVDCVAQFQDEQRQLGFLSALQSADRAGKRLVVRGLCRLPKYSREILVFCNDVNSKERALREDRAAEKRVELHLHTRMSMLDGLTDIGRAFETAARFGHKALAVTDHGVVQAFPEAAKAAEKTGVRAIFGVEGYLLRDTQLIDADRPYVVFDLETTGLKPESAEIIEIGAVKLLDGAVIGRFQTFVNDGTVIPGNITELTGITNAMLAGAPTLRTALSDFSAFSAGCCLVAHNAAFDMGFLRHHGSRFGMEFAAPCADTLMLARNLLHDLENHKLDTVCAALDVRLEAHHRAVDDAEATAGVFLKLMERMRAQGQHRLPVYGAGTLGRREEKRGRGRPQTNHIIILARTQAGMKNLYRLVSYAHLDHFRSRPIIPLSLLSLYRDGLILGSACEQGELYSAILRGEDEEELLAIASFYDYLEIQPRGNNAFLVRQGLCSEEALLEHNREIVRLGEALSKPVVATGDVHFLEPGDAIYREILMTKQGFEDAAEQAPLYFKTTEEMLEEFSYLGAEKAREVVISAPNAIAGLCEALKPFPDGTHAPKIPDAENILRGMAISTAHEIYGDPLPEIVEARLEREL